MAAGLSKVANIESIVVPHVPAALSVQSDNALFLPLLCTVFQIAASMCTHMTDIESELGSTRLLSGSCCL